MTINKERASIVEREREGSITQTQMNELVRRGKDKDATEFDKKSWAYQYQLSSNKLKFKNIPYPLNKLFS